MKTPVRRPFEIRPSLPPPPTPPTPNHFQPRTGYIRTLPRPGVSQAAESRGS